MKKWDAKLVGRRRSQSLAGYRCPECQAGTFALHPDGMNVCSNCRHELITEWEWERRQRQEKPQ